MDEALELHLKCVVTKPELLPYRFPTVIVARMSGWLVAHQPLRFALLLSKSNYW